MRDDLDDLANDLDEFLDDLAGPLADPVAHRAELLTDVDRHLKRTAELALRAAGFGILGSSWGELALWRRQRFREVLAAVDAVATRMAAALAAAKAKLAAADALPGGTPAATRFVLLQQAERLLTTTPTSPRPSSPQKLREIVADRRDDLADRLSDLAELPRTERSTLSGLLARRRRPAAAHRVRRRRAWT